MQDRFKFRGVLKLATQNIVIYSSFLKNYDDELVLSVPECDAVKQIKDAGYKLTDKDWDEIYRYSDQDDYYPMFNFSCERVDYCTGLKDKNGKLIYESDILNSLYRDDGCKGLYVVVWGNGNLYVKKFGNHQQTFVSISLNNLKSCEVIGNIYEHGYLLENKDE